jgi:FKBP-type peptidyl-prolyl cis-trans isomerase
MENKKSMNIVVAAIICLALAGFLVFISINNKTKMASENNNTPVQGEAVAKPGDTVSVNYTGRLQNGTVFDSNIDPKFGHAGQPLTFVLGAGQMIGGFDKAVAGMKVGEKKTITIPPEEAYGAAGRPPVIPPNSTLIFDIELTAIK